MSRFAGPRLAVLLMVCASCDGKSSSLGGDASSNPFAFCYSAQIVDLSTRGMRMGNAIEYRGTNVGAPTPPELLAKPCASPKAFHIVPHAYKMTRTARLRASGRLGDATPLPVRWRRLSGELGRSAIAAARCWGCHSRAPVRVNGDAPAEPGASLPYNARMVDASCHCGAVTISVDAAPLELTSCNCSICRRTGALWSYYSPTRVRVVGPTVTYRWGDKTLDLHHCATCGCITHWSPLDPALDRMGVNARLMEPAIVAAARIRRFDGADTWTFLE